MALLLFGVGLFAPGAKALPSRQPRLQRLSSPDTIKARAALLIDATTGEVLYARNPEEHHLPASTTKLMTALLVYEKVGLKGRVTIEEDDTRVEPSSVPLVPGETVSVKDLMNALLIESANDSARALGRYVAGSTDAFVQQMNRRATALGCYNTHFENPNGLPAPAGTHYTSCSDLMKIFNAVIAHPELRAICSIRDYRLVTRAKVQIIHNHNRLLGLYPGMGPAKTGWTVASHHTYAAACMRNGRQILLTLLDTPNKWIDAQILFNWGFAQKSAAISETPEATAVAELPARDGESLIPASVTMPNAEQKGKGRGIVR